MFFYCYQTFWCSFSTLWEVLKTPHGNLPQALFLVNSTYITCRCIIQRRHKCRITEKKNYASATCFYRHFTIKFMGNCNRYRHLTLPLLNTVKYLPLLFCLANCCYFLNLTNLLYRYCIQCLEFSRSKNQFKYPNQIRKHPSHPCMQPKMKLN